MITKDQIKDLSKTFQIDEYSIFREYLQLIFLSYLYQEKNANKVFFKGGTALRFLFGSPRFSEDLDFSTNYSDLEISKLLKKIEEKINRELPGLTIKSLHKGKEGISFRITYKQAIFKYPFSIRLDFHRQASILNTQISTLITRFPIMIFPQVFHLSGEGILREKFEALETRNKGRDIFDIWFLLSRGIHIERSTGKIINNLKLLPQAALEKDLSKFLPKIQRKVIFNLKDEIIKFIA